MSCTACEAINAMYGSKSHTCSPDRSLDRRFHLAAAALPTLLSKSPDFVLAVKDDECLLEICSDSFRIADFMLRAEGRGDPVRAVAGELVRVLKIVRQTVEHLPARLEIDMPVLDRAIAAAEAAGVTG